MKKTNSWNRLLSLVLCLCMVLSLAPLQSLTVFSAEDVKYIAYSMVDSVLDYDQKNTYTTGTASESATIEAGIDNPEYSRIYFKGEYDETTGYWYAGGSVGALAEVDFSDKCIRLIKVESVSMTGGNVGELLLRAPNTISFEDTTMDITGGYIGTLEITQAVQSESYTIDTDINITVKDAALGTIYGGNDVTDTGYKFMPYTLNGDINIDIDNSTVNNIYDTNFAAGSTHNGDTYIRVLDSTVNNIYVNANSNGVRSGYINSGKLSNTDCFTNLVYLDGMSWMVKGDMDTALNGKDLVIGEDQTLTVSDMTCSTKIVNYGTLTVKNGGILNWVINHGTMILEDGSRVTELDNHGTLTSTGTMYVKNMDNHGTVNFTGTAHSMTHVNNRPNGVFNCHGDHDNMSFYQDLGVFYCDSPDCETVLDGRYYGVQPLTWNGFYVKVTNEQGIPCYTQEYSCTLVPQWEGMLLPETITVYEFQSFTQTLVEGEDYSYDRKTGQFKLFKGAVTFYPLSVTVSAYYPTDLSETEVTLDQDRFLWDGTAKEPQLVSVKDGDTALEEGKDYRFVEYRSNVAPGTGYVVLEGLGEYSGTVSIPFEIYQLDLETGYQMVMEEGTWTFINGEVKPKVESVYGNIKGEDGAVTTVTLEEGKDYTVSYENNIKPGTATVKVTGIGRYKGTLTDTFYINKVSISQVTITGNKAPFTGNKQELNIQVTYNGMVLEEEVDYTLRYSSSTAPQLQYVGDTATVRIEGIGDYFNNSSSFEWSIVDDDLSNFTFVRIEKDGKNLVYTGYPQTPTTDWYVVVKDDAGQEFYVHGSWAPATNVSDISTFTAREQASLSGTIQIPGVISPEHLYNVSAYDTAAGRTYTGQPQKVELRVYMISNDGQVYELVEGEDYTVSGTAEATEPGTYTVTLMAESENFTGSKTVTWRIAPVDISGLEITVPAFTYNGNPQTPDAKVYYTYSNGTKMEIPGTWTSVTNVGDDTTFTAGSEYFTGSVTVEDVVQPLDISALELELEQTAGIYNGDEHWSNPRLEGFEYFDCDLSWDRAPIDVGTYTATVTGTGNFTGTVTRTYEITPRLLTVVIRLEDKAYDGTIDVEVMEVGLEGAVRGDDLVLDSTNLVITLPSADAGTYPTASISGLTLSGEDVKNYTYALGTAALTTYHGSEFRIEPCEVRIIAEEQDVIAGEELDQTKWYVDEEYPLPEGYTLSDVVLIANDSTGEIIPSGGTVTNEAGEDVTKNFSLSYYSSKLTLVCTNHVCNEDGFCANCGGYEMPDVDPGEDPEWDYDDTYLVSKPGHLFWVADYVNKVRNEINVKLIADITVPEGKKWTPILNFYGTFDGNFKTVSGLRVKSDGYWAGFFGGGSYSYGTIKNLHLTDSSFEGDYAVGGIAGQHVGTIENCYVDETVTVKGNSDVGALVGDFAGYMSNCYAYAPVLIGYYNSSYATVDNCYYLSETETEDGGKTADQFASGEVAYLLQSGIQGEDIYDDDWNYSETVIPHIWGQTVGEDAYPTLDGAKVYEVTDCKGETAYCNTEALGHSYEDDVCTVCGHIGVPVKLDSASLSFEEKIHYNIFFRLGLEETVDLSDMGLIMFDSLMADGTVDDAIAIYSGAVEMDGKYMVATDGVHAKYLGDVIYFRAYVRLADGSYVYSKTVQYSAVTYAEHILAGDQPESAKALVVAMLNYGAAAQQFFGYNTDNLVNGFLTEEQKALPKQYRDDMVGTVPVVAAEKQGGVANNKGFSKRVPAVSFEGAFEINFFFTPAYAPVDGITLYYWTEADFEANEVLTVENASGSLKLEGTGMEQYRGDIGGIAAKNLTENIYVAAVYSDSTTTWTSGVLGYSIGAYCASQATKGGTIADLAMATAVYGHHAKAYFG